MINRRLKRLEQSANTNKVYESLNTRLKNLELDVFRKYGKYGKICKKSGR